MSSEPAFTPLLYGLYIRIKLTRRVSIAQSIGSIKNNLYPESISLSYRSLIKMSPQQVALTVIDR